MGCSSSKASAPASGTTNGAQPVKPPSDEIVTAPAPEPVGPDAITLSVDSLEANDVDEGPRSMGSLVSYGVCGVGGRGGRPRDLCSQTESGAVGIAAEPSLPTPAVGSAKTQPMEAVSTRVSGRFRTAALTVAEDLNLSPSPFASVPIQQRAEKMLFWKDLPAREFNVRGLGYKASKTKQPSEAALYNCVAVDVLKGSKGLGNLLSHKRLREFSWWSDDDEGDWNSDWGVPRILIVNCLLPIHNPMGWSKKAPGCSLVAYFRLSYAARDELESGELHPQLKQWQRVVKSCVSTREGASFKAIGQLPEASLSELPAMLQGYNGKPVLVTESANFIKDRLPEILEVDVDVGKWAFLARQTLYSYQGVLAKHAFHAGYLVEGKSDEELPERMIGCFCISGADLAAAMDLDTQ